MTPIDFNQGIYQGSVNRTELLRRLDIASNTQFIKISMIPFGCEMDPEDQIGQRFIGKRYVEKVKDFGDTIKLYKLNHSIDFGSDPRLISGYFFIFRYEESENVFIAVTLENSGFFHHELKPLLNNIFPEFLFAFVKSNSMKKLIQEFSINNDITDIEIKRASQKLRFQEERSMSAVTWPNMSLDEAFAFIHENNGWFKSIQFEAKRYNNTVTEISIDRQGRVRTDRQFNMVYESFIKPLAKMLRDNYKLFSKRSRREVENLAPRPLSIDYLTDIFEDIAINKSFITAISRMGKASVSVIHGNPYVQMSVTDYIDGSSFDIWVLKNNQIIVVPQLKGTVAGIKRLVSHIFDSFAEGEINNYEIAV
jgi:hypothetical protein